MKDEFKKESKFKINTLSILTDTQNERLISLLEKRSQMEGGNMVLGYSHFNNLLGKIIEDSLSDSSSDGKDRIQVLL